MANTSMEKGDDTNTISKHIKEITMDLNLHILLSLALQYIMDE